MFVVPYHQRNNYGRSQMQQSRDRLRDDTQVGWLTCGKAALPQFGQDLSRRGCSMMHFYNPGANLANAMLLNFNDLIVAVLVRGFGYNPSGDGEVVPEVHPSYIPLIPRKVGHGSQTRTEDRGAGG